MVIDGKNTICEKFGGRKERENSREKKGTRDERESERFGAGSLIFFSRRSRHAGAQGVALERDRVPDLSIR